MERNLHLHELIAKIPSLDSDLSSSDNDEEEISVLQRPPVIHLEGTRMNQESVSLQEPEVKLFTSWTDDDQKGDANPQLPAGHKTEGLSNLSLTPLDSWDLDQVLQTLKQHKPLDKPIQTNILKDNDSEMHENDLMEQLIAFCEKKVNEIEIKMNHVSSSKTHNIQKSSPRCAGRQIKDFKETSEKLIQDFPTIHIDLRNNKFETNQSANSQSNSVTSPVNTEKDVSSTKRTTNTNAKASEQKRKNALLEKSGHSKQIEVEMSGSWRNPQDLADAGQKNSSGKIIRENQLCDFETNCSKPGIHVCCSSAKYEQNKHNSQCSPSAQNKQSHKVRWQKDLKFLQTFRPQHSANSREEAAERTDVLYDPEASYLPTVNTLPADLKTRERLLLTVSLSSPGVVAGRMQRKAQAVDSVFIKSHVYNALIAWFLSLTDSENCNRKGNNLDAPFWVAGLQQFYNEDGLALYVCAMSLEDEQTSCRKSRMRKVEKDESMFYRRVCKFFAQTSLKSVAFWVPQLNHLLEEQAYPTNVYMPSTYLNCFISVNPNTEAAEKAFRVIPGFYWQTLETKDQKCQRTEATNSQECHTETGLVLIGRELFLNPLAMHHTLELMCRSSLDVCGIRFLYPPQELIKNFAVSKSVMHSEGQPVLAMAFRGPHANSVWQEITGPSDPQLARRTDPASINALYHHSQDHPVLYSPRLANLVHLGLCLWFGGRIAKSTLSMIQDSAEGDIGDKSHILTSSPATLCTTVTADIFLLVSPVVGPCCYSYILSACAKAGFSLLGLQRVQISRKQTQLLGLTTKQAAAFCHAPTVLLDGEQVELSSHCLVLLMRKESGVRHCSRLPLGCMNELAAQGLIGSIRARFTDAVGPHVCFHTLLYSKSHHNVLGRLMWTDPKCRHMVLSKHTYPSWPDVEQVVILTLTGQNIMKTGMDFLHTILRGDAADHSSRPSLQFLPLHHIDTPGLKSQSFYSYMAVGPEPLLTLALLKPGAWRHCFGKILTLIKQNGYTLVGLRVLQLDSTMANALTHPSEQQNPAVELELKYLRSGPSLVLGLLRVNAVMRLLELIGPEDPVEARTIDQTLWRAQYGSDRIHNGIYGSPSYRKAVEDIKLLFPEGVCCAETSAMRHEKISCLRSDPDASLDREWLNTPRNAFKNKFEGPLVCSALCQTTCLLIPSNLLQERRPPLYSELLQQLLRTGCHPVAGKLCTPDEKQRLHISELLRSSAGGSFLLEGPCLIIALQADNAVTCFDIILERVCRERPDFRRVTMKLLYPNSESGAEKLLRYLFDDHSLDSLHRVAPQ